MHKYTTCTEQQILIYKKGNRVITLADICHLSVQYNVEKLSNLWTHKNITEYELFTKMITNKICINRFQFLWSFMAINIFVYPFYFIYSLGIQRGGRAGGGWGRIWENNKDIKWGKEQIMERIPCFLTVVWFPTTLMAASVTPIYMIYRCSQKRKRKRGEPGSFRERKRPNKNKILIDSQKLVHLSDM